MFTSIEALSSLSLDSRFDLVIIDDAHRVNEIENILVMNELKPNRIVLLGDEKMTFGQTVNRSLF